MLSQSEREQLDQALYDTEIAHAINLAKKSCNANLLFALANSYNWDDGMVVPTAIANNTSCDLGTALALFWHASAIEIFMSDTTSMPDEDGWLEFCQTLIRSIERGAYAVGPVSYDPGLNQVQLYKCRKAGVPAVFFTPVLGTG